MFTMQRVISYTGRDTFWLILLVFAATPVIYGLTPLTIYVGYISYEMYSVSARVGKDLKVRLCI